MEIFSFHLMPWPYLPGLRIDGAPVFELFGTRQHELIQRVFPHGGDLLALVSPALDDPSDRQAVLLHFFHAMEAMGRIGWNPYLHDPKLAARLPLVDARTLVVWGADDAIVPLVHGETYASTVPGGVLEVLDGCGHLPALERPAELAATVAAFVERPLARR